MAPHAAHLVFCFLYFLIQVHGGDAGRGGCPKATLVSVGLGDTTGASLKLPGIAAYLNLPSFTLSRVSVPDRQIPLIPGLLSISVPSGEPADSVVTLNFPKLKGSCPTPPGILLPRLPFLPQIRIQLHGRVTSSHSLTPGFQIPTLPFMPTLRVNLPTTPKFKGIRAKGIKLPFIKIGLKEVVTNLLQLKIKIPYLVPHVAFRPLGSIILNPFNLKFLPGVTSDRPALDNLLNPKNKPTKVGYSPSIGSSRSAFAKFINPFGLPFFPGSGGTSPRGIISILINPLNIKSLPGAGVAPPRSILGNFVNPYKLPFMPFSGDDVPRNIFSVIINPLNIKAFAGSGKQKSPSLISSYLNPLNIIGLAGVSGGRQGRPSRIWNMIQDASLQKGLLSGISKTIGFNVSRKFGLLALIKAAISAFSAFPVISASAAPMVFRFITKPFSFKIMTPTMHFLIPKIKIIV